MTATSTRVSVPLESILCTQELYRRAWRVPSYETEHGALAALVAALAASPATILQTLADTLLEVCQAESAGVSLLTSSEDRFYWPAISGVWKPHIGGGTPRDFGPCGDVLDRNTSLLMTHVERRYTYFQPVKPAVEEALLVPFYVEGKAVGTLWAVTHSHRHKFDAEDERVMRSLGKFASSAYQTVTSLDHLKSQIAERENAQASLRMLADSLETKVCARTRELEERNGEVVQQAEQQAERLRELSNRLVETQDQERRHLARELHDSAGQILAALGMNLAAIDNCGSDIPARKKAVQESEQLVQQLSKEIRVVSYLLHPPLLDERGLTAAIRWYIDGLMERSSLKVELEMYDSLGKLPVEMEMALFRIVQECLTNIHRHSGSETAKIRLSRDGRSVALEIRDAGTGMSAEKLAAIKAQRSGVGIMGMRERIRCFKGTMEIQSGVKGTIVSVRLPMSQ